MYGAWHNKTFWYAGANSRDFAQPRNSSKRRYLYLNQFDNLAIEAEMAFQTGAGVEINSVFPVIESHNYVFALHKKFFVRTDCEYRPE